MPAKPKPTTSELALVTGAGRRLGREIALGLARQGMAVGIHYFRSARQAADTAAEVERLGQQAFLFKADLRRPEDIQKLFEEVALLPNRLAVLVNSASDMPRGDILKMPVDEWDEVLNLNLRAPMLCARLSARLMEPEGGVIINISDSGAGKAWTGYPAYTVSKAGLDALTRVLARALAPNIRVNAIAPGLILASPETNPEDWERLVKRLPMQHSGDPEDVVRTLVFLLNNRYITGEVIRVDGGYHLV